MKNSLIFTSCLLFSVLLLMQFGCTNSDTEQEKTPSRDNTRQNLAASYTNSIGMKFKNIPPGSFYMGSCKESATLKEKNKKRKFLGQAPLSVPCPSGAGIDNDAWDSETPQHKVRISKAFYIGVYEVTLGQFKKFIAGAGRDGLLTADFIKYNSHGDSAAVSYVSWNDAQAFINWLNKKEVDNHYRLPTEAEWEYAARGGTTTIYFWGNSKSQAGSYAWFDKNAYNVGDNYAHSVGRKQSNPWGLYDMHGNVSEWVQDWFDKNYYRNSLVNDPKGPSSGRYRVNRGGSYIAHTESMRSAYRYANSPGDRDHDFGFRLLRQP